MLHEGQTYAYAATGTSIRPPRFPERQMLPMDPLGCRTGRIARLGRHLARAGRLAWALFEESPLLMLQPFEPERLAAD